MATLKGKHPQLEAVLIGARSVCPQTVVVAKKVNALQCGRMGTGICGGVTEVIPAISN